MSDDLVFDIDVGDEENELAVKDDASLSYENKQEEKLKLEKVDTSKIVDDVNVTFISNTKLKPFGRVIAPPTIGTTVSNKPKSVRQQTIDATGDAVQGASLESLGDLPGNIMYNMMENLENSLHNKKEKVKGAVKNGLSGVANGVMAAKFPQSQMMMASLNNGNTCYLVPGTIVMDMSGNMVMMSNNMTFAPAQQSDLASAAFNAGFKAARNALLNLMTPDEALNRFGFSQQEISDAINKGQQSQQQVTNREVEANVDSMNTRPMSEKQRRTAALMRSISNEQRLVRGRNNQRDDSGLEF